MAEPISARVVNVQCPSCGKSYALNEASLDSAFACRSCGALVGDSGLVQPGTLQASKTEKVAPSRRDTQPISRGDTQKFERPNLAEMQPSRAQKAATTPTQNLAAFAVPRPVDLDDLPPAPVPQSQLIRRRGAKKGQNLLVVGSIVALCGVALVLLVVFGFMLLNRGGSAPSRIQAAPAIPAPVALPEKEETEAERDHRIAWQQMQKLNGEIENAKRKIERLQIALREATSKHFPIVQKDLQDTRAQLKELQDRWAQWEGQYNRSRQQLGK